MTKNETRQLAIEFERRLLIIYPLDSIKNKLDTETIYSFLSQFQLQYIKSILANLNSSENTYAKVVTNEILKTLIKHLVIKAEDKKELQVVDDKQTKNVKYFNFPTNFLQYVRSSSIVSSTYNKLEEGDKEFYIPNIVLSEYDIANVIESSYNEGAIIKNPIILSEYLVLLTAEGALTNLPELVLMHDSYTNVKYLDLYYLSKPKDFNIMNPVDSLNVSDVCELPFSCFDDLVQGAVDMYITEYKFKLYGVGKDKQQKEEAEQ